MSQGEFTIDGLSLLEEADEAPTVHTRTRQLLAILVATITGGTGVVFLILWKIHGSEPCDKPIPMYIIVCSGKQFALAVLSVSSTFSKLAIFDRHRETQLCGAYSYGFFKIFAFLVSMFSFCWFITGNVWVFSTNRNDCPTMLYTTAFIYIITLYSLFAFGCCCTCCCVVAPMKFM